MLFANLFFSHTGIRGYREKSVYRVIPAWVVISDSALVGTDLMSRFRYIVPLSAICDKTYGFNAGTANGL